jgi:hypothetical protein
MATKRDILGTRLTAAPKTDLQSWTSRFGACWSASWRTDAVRRLVMAKTAYKSRLVSRADIVEVNVKTLGPSSHRYLCLDTEETFGALAWIVVRFF